LKLPAELRNTIYGYISKNPALTSWLSNILHRAEINGYNEDHYCLASYSSDKEANVVNDDPSLSLIYINRQIHAETHIRSYMTSIFRF
jgi:hypothetical protein